MGELQSVLIYLSVAAVLGCSGEQEREGALPSAGDRGEAGASGGNGDAEAGEAAGNGDGPAGGGDDADAGRDGVDGTEGEGEPDEGTPAGGGDGRGEGDVEAEGAGEGLGGAEGEGEGEGDVGGPCGDGDRECRGEDVWYCLAGGEWVFLEACEPEVQACIDGACRGCEPGALRCLGNQILRCEDDELTETVQRTCRQGTVCAGGACVGPCGAGDDKVSNAGCTYWAVDLDNIREADRHIAPAEAQYAVVIANLNDVAVNVDVYRSDGPGQVELVLQQEVAANDVGVLELPPRSQEGTGTSFTAYRLETDQRIVAYQFNPMHNTEQAFSNDASLLIPENALGREYFAVTADAMHGNTAADPHAWGAYVTVVGTTEDPVEVVIESPVELSPPENGELDIDGRTVRVTLRQYEVVSVHSQPPPFMVLTNDGGNLSGTRVTASAPVAVFAGNMATSIPMRSQDWVCCAEHVEEQMWPVQSWGTSFVAARSLVRRPSQPEEDWWRLIGSVDGTRLFYTPARPPGAPTRLDRGESTWFPAAAHFTVEASEPVLLAQFLSSAYIVSDGRLDFAPCDGGNPAADQECTDRLGYLAVCMGDGFDAFCGAVSDPAMILVPPIQQFRQDYKFLAPDDYHLDFINVIAQRDTVVQLDGEPVANWVLAGSIGLEGWQVATVVVEDGAHTVTANGPVGVLVYGYDSAVSYGYAGGLNLEIINR